jgi:hypothetical protein
LSQPIADPGLDSREVEQLADLEAARPESQREREFDTFHHEQHARIREIRASTASPEEKFKAFMASLEAIDAKAVELGLATVEEQEELGRKVESELGKTRLPKSFGVEQVPHVLRTVTRIADKILRPPAPAPIARTPRPLASARAPRSRRRVTHSRSRDGPSSSEPDDPALALGWRPAC